MALNSSRKEKKKEQTKSSNAKIKIEPMNVASMVVPVYGGKNKKNSMKVAKSKKSVKT